MDPAKIDLQVLAGLTDQALFVLAGPPVMRARSRLKCFFKAVLNSLSLVMGVSSTPLFFTTFKWLSVRVILPSLVGMVHIRIVRKKDPGNVAVKWFDIRKSSGLHSSSVKA